MCKISIITVNYNDADGLRKTLESVSSQTSHSFEHIIIDGGSNDNSVSMIQSYEESINQSSNPFKIIWISKKDK